MKTIKISLILFVSLLAMLFTACSTQANLDGTSWSMTFYRDTQGNLTEILPATTITANFEVDQVSGDVACNNFIGAYQTTDSTISIGPLAATLRECIGPDGIMEQETAFLSAMEAAVSYNIKGDTLELTDEKGAVILKFKMATDE